jgi:hypothetical protein
VWGEPILAGLPHLLFALSSEGSMLAYYLGDVRIDKQVPPLVFFGLIVVSLILAGILHWPRWSAGWIGYAFVMAQLMPLGPGSRYTIAGQVSSGIPFFWANLIFVVLVLAAVVIGLLLARRDRVKGLLMMLSAVPVFSWLSLDAVNPMVRLVSFVAIGLATAVAAGIIFRMQRVMHGVGVALALSLVVSLSVAYLSTYQTFLATEPAVAALMISFISGLVVSAMLVTWPVWVWEAFEQVRQVIAGRAKKDG